MRKGQRKALLPVEDLLAVVDQTVAEISSAVVEYARQVDNPDTMPFCTDQWWRLEKAACKLLQADDEQDDTLASITAFSAKKELITRALALMECMAESQIPEDSEGCRMRVKKFKGSIGGDL